LRGDKWRCRSFSKAQQVTDLDEEKPAGRIIRRALRGDKWRCRSFSKTQQVTDLDEEKPAGRIIRCALVVRELIGYTQLFKSAGGNSL
jgi:hypothetical protein